MSCDRCGGLLDVMYQWDRLPVPRSLSFFEHRWATKGIAGTGRLDFSGVWRFRELLPFYGREEDITTIGTDVIYVRPEVAQALEQQVGGIQGAMREAGDKLRHSRENVRPGEDGQIGTLRQHQQPERVGGVFWATRG